MMVRDAPFEIDYQHDRRKHRHRCIVCNRIVNTGERVLMVKIRKGSKVAHISCADAAEPNGWTMRDRFDAWARERARELGYRVDLHPMSLVGGLKKSDPQAVEMLSKLQEHTNA